MKKLLSWLLTFALMVSIAPAAFADENGEDTSAPVLENAVLNGSTVTLTYNEELKENYPPTASLFRVYYISPDNPTNTEDSTITGTWAVGKRVYLKLAEVVDTTETVYLAYTTTTGGTYIQDLAGNLAADIYQEALNNETGTCGENVKWSYSNGALSFTGTGAMEDYESRTCTPWHALDDKITSVSVAEGITHIGSRTMCFNKATSVEIPASVTSVGDVPFGFGDIQTIKFLGNAPTFVDVQKGENNTWVTGGSFCSDKDITVRYPANDSTWNSVIGKNYSEDTTVTWVAYGGEATVAITGAPSNNTVTYGDAAFTLGASIDKNDDTNGTWNWTSDNIGALVIENEHTATPTVKIVGISTAPHIPIKITASYSGDKYEGTGTVGITVNQKELTVSGIVAENKTYSGAKDATLIYDNAKLNGVVLGDENDVSLKSDDASGTFADADVGTNKTVTVTGLSLEGNKSYFYKLSETPVTVTANITARPIVIRNATAEDRRYEKGNKNVDITEVTFGTVGDEGYSGPLSERDYVATGVIEDENVGTHDVAVTVALNNKNFSLANNTTETTVNITKAYLPHLDSIHLVHKAGESGERSISLAGLVDDVTEYSLNVSDYGKGILNTGVEHTIDSAGTLKYTLSGLGPVDETAIIAVSIKSKNYNDTTVGVYITLTEKNIPTVKANDITRTYDGSEFPESGISGTATYDGVTVDGAWKWVAMTRTHREVSDSGRLAVKFVPSSDEYAEVYTNLLLTINKASPTGKPTYLAINAAGKTLGDANITADNITPSGGTITWDLGNAAAVTQGTSYGWTYVPADRNNYSNLTGNIVLWPNASSSGGSGSSGSSGSSSTTKKNPDGSVTTTTTDKKTGTVTEKTKNTDGSVLVVETQKDGTVTKTNTNADGSFSAIETKPDGTVTETNQTATGTSATTVTDADGNTVESSVNISEDDAKSGDVVTVPIEVSASDDKNNASKITVSVPEKSSLSVEFSVENATPSTVVVIVNEDGTEEVLKMTKLTDNGVSLVVSGNVTIKIVDNTKEFSDTEGHWAEDSIDFLTSRELLNGTGNGKFDADGTMTRGMVNTVLARLNGVDVNGENWQEIGTNWAIENGISDGSNPESELTREQLVTMLYRYVGEPENAASDSADSFKDGGDVSAWASDAMEWAISIGLLSGDNNGALNPGNDASRAEVATILMRFIQKMA